MALTEKNLSIVSRIGGRKENQDNAIVHTSQHGTILIVCDGAGGYNGGKYASAFVCQYIVTHFKQYNGQIDIKDFLLTVITNANIELLNIASGDPEKEGMKTTLAMAHIKDSKTILFHVGDSRIYHFKLGQLAYRTEDHSYVNELLLQKRITKKEAENHPKSNVITNAMGVHPSSFRVEVKDLNVGSSDLLLLTTDGCHGLISQSKLQSMVRKYADLGELCHKICDYCEMQGQQVKRGMYDNLTIIAYSENYRFWPVPVKKTLFGSFPVILLFVISAFAINNFSKDDTAIDYELNSDVPDIYSDDININGSANGEKPKDDTSKEIKGIKEKSKEEKATSTKDKGEKAVKLIKENTKETEEKSKEEKATGAKDKEEKVLKLTEENAKETEKNEKEEKSAEEKATGAKDKEEKVLKLTEENAKEKEKNEKEEKSAEVKATEVKDKEEKGEKPAGKKVDEGKGVEVKATVEKIKKDKSGGGN
jgi:serine/threonine protein phosphatase PrpC